MKKCLLLLLVFAGAFAILGQGLTIRSAFYLPSVKPVVASGSNCDSVNDSSLKAYWKLDEASGTRNDSKGSNNLTDNNSVGSTAAKISNGADFTAASSMYLSSADTADLSMTSSTSIFFWLKRKSTGTQGIFDKDTEYVSFIIGASDQIKFTVFDSVSGSVEVNSTETISTGTWYFVVLTYDSSDKKVRSYINDGSATVSAGALSNGPLDAANTFYLGYGGGTGSFGDIILDEFGKTNRLLTSDERTALYNAGSACRPSGL